MVAVGVAVRVVAVAWRRVARSRPRPRGVITDAPVSGQEIVHALSRAMVSTATSSNDDSSARFDPITAREKDDTACIAFERPHRALELDQELCRNR